jgi:hypothetical protein
MASASIRYCSPFVGLLLNFRLFPVPVERKIHDGSNRNDVRVPAEFFTELFLQGFTVDNQPAGEFGRQVGDSLGTNAGPPVPDMQLHIMDGGDQRNRPDGGNAEIKPWLGENQVSHLAPFCFDFVD